MESFCIHGHALTPDNLYAFNLSSGEKTYFQCQRKLKRGKKDFCVEYKGGKCVDCNGVFPSCCYQFDHRVPDDKSFGITDSMAKPVELLKPELDKCDLVCTNCHAVRIFGNEQISAKISRGMKTFVAAKGGNKETHGNFLS